MSTPATTAEHPTMQDLVQTFRSEKCVDVSGLSTEEVLELIKEIGGPWDEFTVTGEVLRSEPLLVTQPCSMTREHVLSTAGRTCGVCGLAALLHRSVHDRVPSALPSDARRSLSENSTHTER